MKNINEYNQNPHYCKQCNKPILCTDSSKLSQVKKKIFCNSSCAASYNNKNIVRNPKGNPENFKHMGKKCLIDNFTDKEIIELYTSFSNLLEFSKKLGYKTELTSSYTSVINRLSSIGIDINSLPKLSQNPKIIYKPNKSSRTCTGCDTQISYYNKSGMCPKCLKEKQDKEQIDKWLQTGDTGYSISSTIRGCIRKYIYDEQNGKCAICNMDDIWNGKKINFILDHIDGNAANNDRSNMRLICPNCDSQLDTYKSKNKNSARNFRHNYNEKYSAKAS